ncbi:glycosyltransferase family protein [Leptolyngbya sp. AN02str]|uniref:glycosyltransferase family protein n=1 Tax=Leptolyngbya sp. AN02str TaxID=3423363 RepID=UPI003D31A117
MKIALHYPFVEHWAESELAQRIEIAAQRLGWQALALRSPVEILHFAPDFVLALHHNSQKLWPFPTYGCMWNPPAFFDGVDVAIQTILNYDGYLIASRPIEAWLDHQLQSHLPTLKAPFYPSCFRTPYQSPSLENPRLVYLGSNWDGDRFLSLFQLLDRLDFVDIYGRELGWHFLQKNYRGSLPFDGVSVLKVLNQAGVGLCLHRPEHRQAEVPSMRLFEIVAAGAIAICGDHPFIRRTFGDTVLYLDPDSHPAEQVQHIQHHMNWIAAHPEAAHQLSQRAHQIFVEQYSLENLLQTIGYAHQHGLLQRLKEPLAFMHQYDRQQVQYLVEQLVLCQQKLAQVTHQRDEGLTQIQAMESSKFWKVRSHWIRIKQRFKQRLNWAMIKPESKR